MKILRTILKFGLLILLNALLLCVIFLIGCFLANLINQYINWPAIHVIMLLIEVSIFVILSKKIDKLL